MNQNSDCSLLQLQGFIFYLCDLAQRREKQPFVHSWSQPSGKLHQPIHRDVPLATVFLFERLLKPIPGNALLTGRKRRVENHRLRGHGYTNKGIIDQYGRNNADTRYD
jgi:hypothetical protein